jgi:hypothetical protein
VDEHGARKLIKVEQSVPIAGRWILGRRPCCRRSTRGREIDQRELLSMRDE